METLNVGNALMKAEPLTSNEVLQPEILQDDAKYGIRINFKATKNKPATVLAFEFDANGNPIEIANEINNFMQNRIAFLSIKNEKGQSPFVRKSDIFPNRRCTIDLLYQNRVLKGAIYGVEIKPSHIAKDNGKTFFQSVTKALQQSKPMIDKIDAKVHLLQIA